MPRRFVLYRDEATPSLDVGEVADFLHRTLAVPVVAKSSFTKVHGRDKGNLATAIAATRVSDVSRPLSATEPSYGEIAYEMKLLKDARKKAHGVLYDGGRLMSVLRDILPPRERDVAIQHVVFTSRLVCTFSGDGRYHARVNICGYPSIISTSGIVEAPAKPKEFYVLKQRFLEAGEAAPFELIRDRFAGQFIDYDDPRLTEVLKGYALQCAMHAITGRAFCEKRTCRLFNAHWQSEVLTAQLGGKGLCKKHEEMMRKFRRI